MCPRSRENIWNSFEVLSGIIGIYGRYFPLLSFSGQSLSIACFTSVLKGLTAATEKENNNQNKIRVKYLWSESRNGHAREAADSWS